MLNAIDILAEGIKLERGEHIIIDFTTFNDMETMRSALGRELKKMRQAAPTIVSDLLVQRESSVATNIFKLKLARVSRPTSITKVKKDGTEEDLTKETPEEKRIRLLMEKDGVSPEATK